MSRRASANGWLQDQWSPEAAGGAVAPQGHGPVPPQTVCFSTEMSRLGAREAREEGQGPPKEMAMRVLFDRVILNACVLRVSILLMGCFQCFVDADSGFEFRRVLE